MENITWIKTAAVSDFPENTGMAVLVEGKQIAVFNFTKLNKWFAMLNRCPHKGEQCLARGILGDLNGVPKVACPFHKKMFNLETGESLSGEPWKVKTYPVKIEDGLVFIGV